MIGSYSFLTRTSDMPVRGRSVIRHVVLCLLTSSSDIWVSVRFFLLSSFFFSSFFLLSFFLPSFFFSHPESYLKIEIFAGKRCFGEELGRVTACFGLDVLYLSSSRSWIRNTWALPPRCPECYSYPWRLFFDHTAEHCVRCSRAGPQEDSSCGASAPSWRGPGVLRITGTGSARDVVRCFRRFQRLVQC